MGVEILNPPLRLDPLQHQTRLKKYGGFAQLRMKVNLRFNFRAPPVATVGSVVWSLW